MESTKTPEPIDDMFRPPVNRAMRVLDRSFFVKRIPLSAARVFDNKNISKCRTELTKSKDILFLDRFPTVKVDDGEGGDPKRKCVLLKPEIKHDGLSKDGIQGEGTDVSIDELTWTPKIKELLEAKEIGLRPYEMELGYDFWTYRRCLLSQSWPSLIVD